MTLILAHQRIMACDSIQLSNGLSVPSHPGYRKIVRLPDRSLFGVAGGRLNGDALQNWALDGMNFDKPPKLCRTEDDLQGYYWMWMRNDGRVFIGDYDLLFHETAPTDTFGEGDACTYTRGVLDALLHPLSFSRAFSQAHGADARTIVQRTMDLVTGRCTFTRPPVHIFDLDHPENDP